MRTAGLNNPKSKITNPKSKSRYSKVKAKRILGKVKSTR